MNTTRILHEEHAAWADLIFSGGVDRHKSVLNGPFGPLPHNLASGLARKNDLSLG